MVNSLIIGMCVFAAVLGISVATWSILRTRAMVRRLQKTQRLEQIAAKLYLVVVEMLVRTAPDERSLENVQPYESLPAETKGMYRELAIHYFSDLE